MPKQPRPQRQRSYKIPGIFAVVILFITATIFFWKQPLRIGEFSVKLPDGTSLTFNVKNSNNISEILKAGLESSDTHTAMAVSNSLISIIENLPQDNELGKKLVELAENRKPPFNFVSKPVKLVYGDNMPKGFAGVCESSDFIGKNIVVFILNDKGELINRAGFYADANYSFPCSEETEKLLVNSNEILVPQQNAVYAKKTL